MSSEWCPLCQKMVVVDEALSYVLPEEDQRAQVEVYCTECHAMIRVAYCIKADWGKYET